MQTINEDIKNGTFRRVYLLYGDEDYLKLQYKNKLLRALVTEGDTMNFSRFEGKEAQVPALIDLAETMPFFAEHRVILVEDSGFFKNAAPQLAEYLPDMPETTCMIFIEKEVDKRSKTYKSLKDIGRMVEFKTPDEKMLTRWVLTVLQKNGKKLTQPTMQLFLEKAGNSMGNVDRELEKLICYVGDREIIQMDDVEEICTGQTENRIFDMIHMMAEKRQKEALELYYDLLALKEPPMRILFLLVRQFNILLQVKTMVAAGMEQNQIADRAGLRSFTIRRYRSEAGHFSVQKLKEALRDCARAEEDVKTGRLDDRLSVELILVKYSA
ncbi:DNA polymerase III subunit delta [Oscillospiraceae bacterium Marseille-Q3528]|nr:DNA polymerase III subunit delta [Oscillospiraceae bacterium Marseille-Q3528]